MRDIGGAISWRELLTLVRRWQRTPGTALCESVHGEQWGATEHLLATVLDALGIANWQRAGNRSAPRPKPVPRPGQTTPGARGLGRDAIPIDRFDAWWDRKEKTDDRR